MAASMQRSPKASTLLREPLLRDSGQQVSVRLKGTETWFQRSAPPDMRSMWQKIVDSCRELPREVMVVLLIDFLNSYRSFGFRSVQYAYMTNEFGLSDVDTAYLLGVQSWLLVIFGMLGAVLVDAYGVRSTALASLCVAVVSRAILTFGRTREALVFALLGLAPFGEAVLSTGIYTVALKKLTTPATRGFAFGVQYGVFNLAGALADVAADSLRTQDTLIVPEGVPLIGGMAWSGMRTHLLGTWLALLASLGVAIPLLWDVVIINLHEPPAPLSPTFSSSPPPRSFLQMSELEALRATATPEQLDRGYVVRPDPRLARGARRAAAAAQAPPASPPHSVASVATWAVAASRRSWRSLRALLAMRVFWRALWLSVCLFWISKQWGDLDQLLPAYLERQFGEDIPIYTIHSINTWVCMLGPSIAAALTSHLEAFSVMLPGLWVMALSPAPLVLFPGIAASAAWVVLMSVGEVIWSPRQSAWIASLAPDGREGVFLALLSLKSLITAIPSTAFNGMLNDAYNPNCEKCRDGLGHFCSIAAPLPPGFHHASGAACATSTTACVGGDFSAALNAPNVTLLHCPDSCQACPGWESQPATMWLIVLVTSVSSPLMVAFTVRFLRGEGEGDTGDLMSIPTRERASTASERASEPDGKAVHVSVSTRPAPPNRTPSTELR